jgi:hypothetical protein
MKTTRLQLEPLEARQMLAAWSPGLRISDASVDEGGIATLTVTRDDTSYLTGSVKWATASGTAGSSDYLAASGTIKFGSRELSRSIQIQTQPDAEAEGLESFAVNLSSAKYGTIRDGKGVVTIRDGGQVTPPPPAPTTERGPQQNITAPAGAIQATSISQVNDAPAGATIYLKAGVYSGTITPKSGQTIIGEYGAILRGTGNRAINPAANVTIRNLVIDGYRPTSEWGAAVHLGAGSKLIQCEVKNSNIAGVFVEGDGVTVEACTIHHNQRLGLKVQGNTGARIINNEVAYNNPANTWDGYWEAGGSKFWETTNALVEGNHFHHNTGGAIWFDYRNSGAIVRNNLTEANTRAGIIWEISFDAIIEGNTSKGDGVGYPYGDWQDGGGVSIQNSRGTAEKPIIVRNNTVTNSHNGIGLINDTNRDGGIWNAAYVQFIGNAINDSGASGISGTKPVGWKWESNILTGSSRLVGNP